ncbi:MAG TPA: precorrin-6y C5,15-methyltransferase (decarboxylating) subunit CbiE [Candidatus Dormibacteraeota bacterium]|jgi:precorrin-6Y C5,15-methyltransferase (decarboxylating)|nr:precorrin-6y C5,15-methyltransferase (decarboxylating) subunit CbiE [Candidatus Dormibacteraeota bacterium]
MSTPPVIVVVGVPPSGMDAVDPRGRAAIDTATLLCGGQRHLDEVPSHGEERIVIGDVDACVERLRGRGPGEQAVVLATGDPLCFGMGATLVRRLGREQVTVVPATSSVQVAFARAGVPWDDARILSAHGRPLAPVVPHALDARTSAIFCGPDNPPQRVAQALIDGGMEDCRCVVAEQLGGPVERVVDAPLSAVACGHFDPLSVVIVDRDGGAAQPEAASSSAGSAAPTGLFGRPEDAFSHARGMITRAEVRAVGLSLLQPGGASVIWDIGAGSGSIGIEAAALAPHARVYAVERDPEQLSHLRANVAALGHGLVDVVEGDAPAALSALPDPDRVVVGGHGGNLGEILGVVRARLRPGGRLVAHFATLDGVLVARATLGGWSPQVTALNVARGVDAGRSLRLHAEDPVFLVSAEAPR